MTVNIVWYCFNIKHSEIRWLQIFLIDFEVTFIHLSYFEICWLLIVLNLFWSDIYLESCIDKYDIN